ncbi:MAG: VWA domain-containing protein [Fuerstiella sp.]|nr:VWA domain-containing protein [Fuerstiella sp.]
MSTGVSAALFWLVFAVPIIALYFLKVRLRRIPVSTNLFWKQIYEEKPPRSLWQSFRHLLSLLLQLLLLLLLALAVADPDLPWQQTEPRRQVLVIDRSASMHAADVKPTRFAAALSDARNRVNGLRAYDEMAIVTAGVRPEVLVGMCRHLPTLHRALDRLVPLTGPTELKPAVDLAIQLTGEHPRGRIIVLTDGCTAAPETEVFDTKNTEEDSHRFRRTAVHSKPEIQFHLFATDASNIGITQFQVRRSISDPLGYEILSQVRNSSDVAIECRLELELDGLPVDILPLNLKPNELWTRSIQKTSLEGGLLSGRLTEIRKSGRSMQGKPTMPTRSLNGISIDDRARALLPNRKVQKVLIVSPGNLFLQKVFEASPLVEIEVAKKLPAEWPQNTLLVLHQLTPSNVPSGDVLVIDPVQSTDLWTLGESLTDPIITRQDTASALMRHVRLDNVLMPQARKVTAVGSSHLLAGTDLGDPVYVELHRDSGRCLLLTTNLEQSDLAFRTAFPIMVSNALSWFTGTSGELTQTPATGDVTRVSIQKATTGEPAGHPKRQLELIDPDGDRTAIAATPARRADTESSNLETVIGPLNKAGLYRIVAPPTNTAGAAGNSPRAKDILLKTVAVNLSNARESDLRPAEHLKAVNHNGTIAVGGLTRPVWFYLAALAGALALTEWFLYNRRFTD